MEKITLTYSKKKARSKMYEFWFYLLIMLISSYVVSQGDFVAGAFSFSVVFLVVSVPHLIIHLNYIKFDKGKKVIFDYKNNAFQEYINNKLITEIDLNDVTSLIRFKGFSSKHPSSDYHYYKICTKDRVIVFSDLLDNESVFFSPKFNYEQSRFFNLMNLKNDYLLEQAKITQESNEIEYYTNEKVLKFIAQYELKTNAELNQILRNKKDFQAEAVKAAQFILKGRKGK